MQFRSVVYLMLSLIVVGCESVTDTQRVAPAPQALSSDALGYYCNMLVVNHDGPKGQIHVGDIAQPLWFASVRDTLAFTHLPGEPKNLAAIYVNDMTGVSPGDQTWKQPSDGTWIDARHAWYVLDAPVKGGMGSPEPVPFKTEETANTFAARFGGRVVAFANVVADDVIGTADAAGSTPNVNSVVQLERTEQ